MARVVVMVDSATGKLIDANGTVREGARYRKFAGRILSLGLPTAELDYGANGATKLDVTCGGGTGDEINLKAKRVNISSSSRDAVLSIDGKTLDEIIAAGGSQAEGQFVAKSDIADVVDGLYVADDASAEEVRDALRSLVYRLSELAGVQPEEPDEDEEEGEEEQDDE